MCRVSKVQSIFASSQLKTYSIISKIRDRSGVTGNGEIPNFMDGERLKTPKTDCVLKVYKDKEFYQLDSRFVDHQNTGFPATLIKVGQPSITNLRVMWTDGWVMSSCSQDSQKVCTKLLIMSIFKSLS